MIDPKKQYRTRDGREVRIYAVDGGPHGNAIHGAIKSESGDWIAQQWFHEGMYAYAGSHMNDLIEVKPRIKRKVWVNVYRGRHTEWMTVHDERDEADCHVDATTLRRIACVEIDINVDEGHGL